MPLPEDAPPTSSRWAWLDRWLAPPWRALITWVMLVGLSGTVWSLSKVSIEEILGFAPAATAIGKSFKGYFEWLNRLSPWALPAGAQGIAGTVVLGLVWTWFEPFVLRLNLLRGAMWLGLRIGSTLVHFFLFQPLIPAGWLFVGFYLAPTASLTPMLYGWRSRPWVSFAGAILAFGVAGGILSMLGSTQAWLRIATTSVIYGATLLYGTRLLRPDERRCS